MLNKISLPSDPVPVPSFFFEVSLDDKSSIVPEMYYIRKDDKFICMEDRELPGFLRRHSLDLITMETIPFCVETQRHLPTSINLKSGKIQNPHDVLNFIKECPHVRYLLCVNSNHIIASINNVKCLSSTRIIYYRQFKCDGILHSVWISKLLGQPYGIVFNNDRFDLLIKYIIDCVPIHDEFAMVETNFIVKKVNKAKGFEKV